jgi:hypothetical protein
MAETMIKAQFSLPDPKYNGLYRDFWIATRLALSWGTVRRIRGFFRSGFRRRNEGVDFGRQFLGFSEPTNHLFPKRPKNGNATQDRNNRKHGFHESNPHNGLPE